MKTIFTYLFLVFLGFSTRLSAQTVTVSGGVTSPIVNTTTFTLNNSNTSPNIPFYTKDAGTDAYFSSVVTSGSTNTYYEIFRASGIWIMGKFFLGCNSCTPTFTTYYTIGSSSQKPPCAGVWTVNGVGNNTENLTLAGDCGTFISPSAVLFTKDGLGLSKLSTAEILAIINPEKGMTIFDKTTNIIRVFNGTIWTELAPNDADKANLWQKSGLAGNEIKNTNTGGFYTERPPVTEISAFGQPPQIGSGTRLMWMPNNSAFRVGTVTGNQWDNIYNNPIGQFSFASGYNSNAAGNYSTAFGLNSNASGIAAVAIGNGNTASGNQSTAFGFGTIASNLYATAMGNHSNASGYASTAIGGSTVASGSFSTATGESTVASGASSFAVGTSVTASGNYAVATGLGSVASGNSAVAMGQLTIASGSSSFAMGSQSEATNDNSAAIGYSAKTYGNVSFAFGFNATTGIFNANTNIYRAGNYATAIGKNAKATADLSTAIGNGTTANSYGSIALGFFNDPIIPASPLNWSFIPTEPLLLVGNSNTNIPHNALELYKNGNMNIDGAISIGTVGTNVPQAKLNINGDVVLKTTTIDITTTGLANPIDRGGASTIFFTGGNSAPPTNFMLQSIAGGVDGMLLYLVIDTFNSLTIPLANSGNIETGYGSGSYQIGTDGKGAGATLIYKNSKWRFISVHNFYIMTNN